MLSPGTGQWGPSVLASYDLALSVPASHSPMAIGSHRGHSLCPHLLVVVPRADPNPGILAAGPGQPVSPRRSSLFTHLLTITGAATLCAQLV